MSVCFAVYLNALSAYFPMTQALVLQKDLRINRTTYPFVHYIIRYRDIEILEGAANIVPVGLSLWLSMGFSMGLRL